MTHTKYIALVLSAAFGLGGCSMLDIKPDGRETLDEIFNDHNKTAAYLNSCYGNIPGKGFEYDWVCNAPTALSDEGWLTYSGHMGGIPLALYNGTASASSHPLRDYDKEKVAINYYSTYMLQLRYCTTFLRRINGAKVNSEAERARWRAEAHVLRAYFMSEMMKWFGSFAYEPNGYPDDYDYSQMKRRTVWELAEFIDAECTAAIATAELPWRIESANERMRMTKALAWSIKSKMYLFAASPVHSEECSAEEKAAHWQKAFEVIRDAVAALEANGYALKTTVANGSLYQGPAAAYQELFTSTSLTTSSDPETIWQADRNLNALAHNYIGSKTWLNATRAGIVPTQETVDAYEVLSADGRTAVPLLNPANPYNSDKTPNYNQAARDLGFDPADPYAAPRDPRMGVCIVKNGDKVFWNGEMKTIETFVGGDNGITVDVNEAKFTRTGYYFRKYVAPNADAVNGIAAAPWKYFRLAEIKLNLAETAAEAGQLDVAIAQVNDIRRRVRMPDLPTGLSQAETILCVRGERMVELVYEECRYFDVRRWAEPFQSSELYQNFKLRCNNLTAMWITKNPDTGVLAYERKTENLVNRSTQPRDLFLPIPESEAQILYSRTNRRWQNSGW